MADCPNCNAASPSEAVTCPACGVVLQPRSGLLDLSASAANSVPVSSLIDARTRNNYRYGAIAFLVVGIIAVGWLVYTGKQMAREASNRTTARCRLKQLGLAAHNFNDQFHHFPPRNLPTLTHDASVQIDPYSVPQSFFTDLLPYIDKGSLYNQMKPSLPWTHPDQKVVFQSIVSTYQHPSVPVAPKNDDGYALAHFATNSKCICDTKTVTVREITDGTSNTMLLGTVNAGFQGWGDPTNYRDPAKGFGGGPEAFGAIGRETGVQILLFDGAARTVSLETSPEILQRLGDPRDGLPIKDF